MLLACPARQGEAGNWPAQWQHGAVTLRRLSVGIVGLGLLAGCSSHVAEIGPTSPRGAESSPSSPSPSSPTTGASTRAFAVSGLYRPLHFPQEHGERCPVTAGHFVQTPSFGSMTLGSGAVRVGLDNAGEPRKGFVPSAFHGWLALKSHFFSFPRYQGPFLVRARAIGRRGHVRIGSSPSKTGPLLVPSGAGWREQPYFTFVRSPGCYGWQIDGSTFSHDVVVHVLSAYRSGHG